MAIRKLIFGSKSERSHFEHLRSVWGDRFHVHTNLPFLQVCDTAFLKDESGAPFSIDYYNEQRLKKTSIDYVVADHSGAPLVAVDFDGLQEGFNFGTNYRPREGDDEWRNLITVLKLRVAHGSRFPYLVLSSTHFRTISEKVRLTIADGLIGSVLATKEMRRKLDEGFRPEEMGLTREKFESLPARERHEVAQDWVIDQDTIAELENNPLVRTAAELFHENQIREWIEVPYDPRMGTATPDSGLHRGRRITLKHASGLSGTGAVMLPDFRTPGVSEYSVTVAIAKILAIHDLKKNLAGAAPPDA